MRKAMLLLAVFGLVCSLWGADPVIGTWKLNLAKSKLPAGAAANANESMVVFREINADTLEGTSTDIQKDGTKVISMKFTVPRSGGIQTYQQGGPTQGVSVVTTVIDPYTSFNTYLLNGKQVGMMHVQISKDGMSYTIATKGNDAQGKPVDLLYYFEKQ
jgi:hypothetical protein